VSEAPSSLSRYRGVLTLAPLIQVTYRAETLISGLAIISRIFLFYVLWSAIFRPGQVAAGFTVHQAITYSTLVALLVGRRGIPIDTFRNRIREGTIVYLFLRPLQPLQYYWGLNVGTIAFRLFWVLVGWVIAVIVGLTLPPASPSVLLMTLVSVLFAEFVYGFFELFLQLFSFWTIDIMAISALYFFVLQLLSGALVPIWFFPRWARLTLLWSPFAAAVSTPASIYVGRIAPERAAFAIAVQVAWVLAMCVAALGLWKGVERRVVVQGG
jgi:ABC-2 type transport system permease protein